MSQEPYIGISSVATELSMSVSEIHRRMQRNELPYETKIIDGIPCFTFDQDAIYDLFSSVVDVLERKNLIELGKSLESRVSAKKWDEIRDSIEDHDSGYIPTSSEMLSSGEFSDWSDFMKKCGHRHPLDSQYSTIRKMFFEEGKTPKEIAKAMSGKTKKIGIIMEKEVADYLQTNGMLSTEQIKETVPSIDVLVDTQINDMRRYDGDCKAIAREIMLDVTRDVLGEQEVHYFGLPSVNFIDYCAIATDHLNPIRPLGVLVPSRSLVAESGVKEGNIMESIIRNHEVIEGGEIFDGLRLYPGQIKDAVKRDKYKKMRFNFSFLDFIGGFCPSVEETMCNMFEKGHLNYPSVVFVTLNNGSRERTRVLKGRGPTVQGYDTDDQPKLVRDALSHCSDKYTSNSIIVEELFTPQHYQDNVDEMILMGYQLKKRNPR